MDVHAYADHVVLVCSTSCVGMLKLISHQLLEFLDVSGHSVFPWQTCA